MAASVAMILQEQCDGVFLGGSLPAADGTLSASSEKLKNVLHFSFHFPPTFSLSFFGLILYFLFHGIKVLGHF